jgi:hypothetical protein
MDWLRGADGQQRECAQTLHQLARGALPAEPHRKGLSSLNPPPQKSRGIVLGANHVRKLARRVARAAKPLKGTSADPGNPFMRRPFDMADLAPVPVGWRIGPPDFVGAGTPKSGTSWWYSVVLMHPDIYPHRLYDPTQPLRTKELHYFEHFVTEAFDEHARYAYRNAFAAPPGGISGEWSVLYLLHPGCVRRLAQAAPKAKILLLLRNPIDRFISHLNHLQANRKRRLHVESRMAHLFDKYSAVAEAYLHSRYADGLRALLAHFDRSQVLVLQYEQCRDFPERELARTYSFLDVDADFTPECLNRRVNQVEYVVSQPSDGQRRSLAELFQDQALGAVELFPELDLTLWPDFRE